jgi:hypothetical protein
MLIGERRPRPRGDGLGRRTDAESEPIAMWGLHLMDANIALGNLVSIVRKEAAAFDASGR